MQVYSIDGVTPVVHPTAFVHPTAVLIGDVIVGADVYIGPNASLRGDFGRLIVMQGANVQDCCIMHGFPERDTVVEENGHIGHGAVLHCCRIGRNALVGMNAVVMDNAVVGESAIVAAMAFVKAGMTVPARTLAAGIPAKVLRDLSAEEMAWKVEGTKLYHDLARRSLATLQPAQPLREIEPDRKRIVMPDVKPLIEAKAEWLESGLLDKASGE